MFGFWLFMIILIICITILCACIMSVYGEEVIEALLDNSMYEKRLKELEEQVKKILGGDNR